VTRPVVRLGRFRQRGVALMLLLFILVLGGMWFMATRVASLQQSFIASDRARNAVVLNRAKQALIGYVAAQAAKKFEDNPGAMPCPEAPGSFNSTTGQDGQTASSCTLPAVGRFPWRTLGTEKFVDNAGEPLWYVVSPGWAYNGTNTVINSNSTGQLVVDGASGTDSDTVVALIIAPGPALQVPAAAGCAAWNQSRSNAPPPDLRNYLECQNATSPADNTFVTSGPSGSFNDQVLRVTKADVMPGIEAAIADRIAREIVPQVKSVYATSTWGLSATNPLFPYPAPFANPGTANFVGSSTAAGGLLPVNSQNPAYCTGDPRCTTIVAWKNPVLATVTQSGGTGLLLSGLTTCALTSGNTVVQCQGTYVPGLSPTVLTISARANNVAMGLRAFDTTQATAKYSLGGPCGGGGTPTSATVSGGSFVSDGSADITATASFPNLASLSINFCLQINIAAVTDHPILDPGDPTTGWFWRNQWFRLVYYAPAARHTAGGGALPTPSCTTGTSCLNVANVTPAGAQRAILILAGRSINGTTRPSGTLSNYLEFGNATGSYERQLVSTANVASLKKPFNDRIIVLDSN